MLSSKIFKASRFSMAFNKSIYLFKQFSHHNHCLIRNKAPEFSGTAWWQNEFKKITLSQFNSKWVCLFFYPLDFTFVCPTEIVDYDSRASEFEALNCQVIGCSVDSHFSHREFALKPRQQGGLAPLTIPLLSDFTKEISCNYGVLINGENDPIKGASLRGTFIIDPKQVLRHSTVNDAGVGRNVDETLRVLKALQYADLHGEVCPSGWTPGKKTMTPGNSQKLSEFWEKEHAAKH